MNVGWQVIGVLPGFRPRLSLNGGFSPGGRDAVLVLPGFRPRLSLNVDGTPMPGRGIYCVAGVPTPALIERPARSTTRAT